MGRHKERVRNQQEVWSDGGIEGSSTGQKTGLIQEREESRAEMCLNTSVNLLVKLPSVNESRRAELERCTLGKHRAEY